MTSFTQNSILILSGMMEPTAGQVLVCGLDMATNSSKISDLMGICPQHDVLWGGLTAREHLKLYGRLKVTTRTLARD